MIPAPRLERTAVLLCLAVLCALAAPPTLAAETFPSIQANSLGGEELSLPGGLSATAALLVIGFTQTSEQQTVAWRKKADSEFSADPRLTVYPVVVIQNVPKILHGLLLAGIRAGVPKSRWPHFLVVARDEELWKKAVNWRGGGRAYILLLDRQGEIVWRASGRYSDSEMSSLRRAIAELPG